MFKFDLQRFSDVATYDPKQVVVTFGGVELNGFSEDSIIKIKPMSKGIESIVGCHGDVVRTISPDRRHEVTINLLQTSSGNDYLSTIHTRDLSEGDGILPLVIKDLSGNTTFYDSQAWIVNKPEVKRGDDAKKGETEWTLQAAGSTLFVGGND